MTDGLSGGTPLTPAERVASDQDAQLRGVVTEAFRLLPPGVGGISGAGAGGGEGVSPEVLDAVVHSLLELQTVTGGEGLGALDWLSTGLATAPPGDPGDTFSAAMRVRDLLMETIIELDDGQPDRLSESDQELQAADMFSVGTIEVTESTAP